MRKKVPLTPSRQKNASPRKRWTCEEEILDALEACRIRAAQLMAEAEDCDIAARALIERIARIEQARNQTLPVTHPVTQAVREAMDAIGMSDEELTALVKAYGVGRDSPSKIKRNQAWYQLVPDSIIWICQSWANLIDTHIMNLRALANGKLSRAKRNRSMASTQLNEKSKLLGRDLAVLRTQPMPFVDASIPRSTPA